MLWIILINNDLWEQCFLFERNYRQLHLPLARLLSISYQVFMKSRQNYEEKISWDQQIFAGSGIKILIVFGIRDQTFG